MTVKYLTLECNLKINEAGASIYTTKTDIYYVSKKTIDQIKESLRIDKQTGIPHDNSRIMDEMVQFNIIIPNDNKAIWNMVLSGGGFKKQTKLTMLRVAIDKIYFDANDQPTPFDGDIININTGELFNTTGTEKDINSNSDSTTTNTGDTKDENIVKPKESIDPKSKLKEETNTTIPNPNAVLPGFDDLLIEKKSNQEQKQENNKEQKDTEQKLDTTLGNEFFQWLKNSIKDKKLEINNSKAKIHIVNYAGNLALFLVSPRIFKEYDNDNWALVQKQFTRTKYNEKSYNDDNIWKVETITNRINKKPSIIKGYLINNLETLGFTNITIGANKKIKLIIPQKKQKQ